MMFSRAILMFIALLAVCVALQHAQAYSLDVVHSGSSSGNGSSVSSSAGQAVNYGPTGRAPIDPASNEFCNNPPTVANLDLSKYANAMYYSLYISGSARRDFGGRCVTANYSLNANEAIDVLNCGVSGPGRNRPFCVRVIGARRPGLEASKLTVTFPAISPNPFPYNVAAVLGSAKKGYTAAAVYGCGFVAPGTTPEEPGFVIIARSVRNRENTLSKLKQKLTREGYNVDVEFVPTDQKNCLYFNGHQGFSIGLPPGVPTQAP